MDTYSWNDPVVVATLVLALVATASIVVTFIIRARDIAENRRIRKKDRELEIKARALNDMKSLAMEFQELVFLSGTSVDYDRTQWTTRFSNLLYEYSAIVHYAGLFAIKFQKKAKYLENCIADFQKELISGKKTGEKEVIFVVNTEKRLKVREKVINSVTELLEAIIKEKLKL